MAIRRHLAAAVVAVGTLSAPVAAHSGSIRGAARDPLAIPTWLFLLTGGGVVGVSFLLASVVTDRAAIASIHRWRRSLSTTWWPVARLARLAALAALALAVWIGLAGPADATANLSILLVWVVWWGGYVASAYLVGNTWATIDPFRTLAGLFSSLDRTYPAWLGAWPGVVGLLALVWIELATPVATDPRALAVVVASYAVFSVAGSVVYGPGRWFDTVDPVSRVVRYYGAVAPIGRDDDGAYLRLPGAGLAREGVLTSTAEVAFVVALLFATTFDGFVTTGLWARGVRAVAGVGVPPMGAYAVAYLGGFGLFWAVYVGAARLARHTAETYRSTGALARRFAPSLLPIAAGYHLAHNLGTVLALSPTLAAVVRSPLSPPAMLSRLVLPGWFGAIELGFVLLGHLLAVWVAHAVAYDLFPDRLQATRSQYGVTAAMVGYTMVSLWIVSEPYVAPPFLP